MKGVILFTFGLILSLYGVGTAISTCAYGIRKNALENSVSGILEHSLTEDYASLEEEVVRAELLKELSVTDSVTGQRTVEITVLDLEKGIISVRVRECYPQMNGRQKEIVCTKTILADRKEQLTEMVKVQFWIGETMYKEYELQKGQSFVVPKAPDIRLLELWLETPVNRFVGWAQDTDAQRVYTSGNVMVMEDVRYVAITR